MKESEYNEIDRLLRNLAARERSMPDDLAGDELSRGDAHLDADELNSYAEGALPAATRARYTSHLADCDDCRRIVAQLSIASGSVLKAEESSRKPASTVWRQIIAALFTPVVLRYVMPALALVFVGTFAFLAWRQRDASFVAVNQETKAPPSSAAPASGVIVNQNSQLERNAPAERQQQKAQSDSRSGPVAEHSPAAATSGKLADSTEKKRDEAPKTASVVDDSREKDKEVAKNESEATRPFASEPAAAPAPKPTTALAKSPAKVGEDRIEKMDAKDASVARKNPEKQRPADIAAQSGNAGTKSLARDKAKASAPPPPARERAAVEESESRPVNGRRFQRRNGVWVDVAYNSSVATINLTRGSEQYRALIADEPGIDSIVKQLGGEVILVWKGRAYRIK